MEWLFPQYRKLLDKSYYQIVSPTECLELQRLGQKIIETRLVAQTFTDRHFILDLLSFDSGRYQLSSAQEFEEISRLPRL